MRIWMVMAGCLLACETTNKPRETPPVPQPPGPQPTVVEAPAPTELRVPKTARGLIVYSVTNIQPGQPIETGPLTLLDPAKATSVTTAIVGATEVKVGPHLIVGRRDSSRETFVVDLRAPQIVAKKAARYVDAITPDDKLVSGCFGGSDQVFKICVSDGDPQVWKDVFEEPKRGSDDLAVVVAAGREIVHGNYSQLSKLPAFSIRLADKKRTDYPGIIRKSNGSTIQPAYSPNGTKAATCTKDLIVTTLDGSARPQTIKLDAEPTRCECRFSHDDSKLACSILYEASETASDSLWLWDLKSTTKTMVSKELAIGSFAWAPDDTQIVYVGVAPQPDRWVLRTASLDGKTVKDFVTIEMRNNLIDLAGWTAP
jgi:hypothetical protein